MVELASIPYIICVHIAISYNCWKSRAIQSDRPLEWRLYLIRILPGALGNPMLNSILWRILTNQRIPNLGDSNDQPRFALYHPVFGVAFQREGPSERLTPDKGQSRLAINIVATLAFISDTSIFAYSIWQPAAYAQYTCPVLLPLTDPPTQWQIMLLSANVALILFS